MKLFTKAPDGGENSGVTAYFLIEWKPVFSIALLHFRPGTREAFHSHAFNALTLWLRGRVIEERLYNAWFVWNFPSKISPAVENTEYRAGALKVTRRDNMHRVRSLGNSWALTLRGPWKDEWKEFKDGKLVTLTHGRKVVS